MDEFDVQRLDELVKKQLESEFKSQEDDIQRAKDFNQQEESHQRELLKASGFDLNLIDQFD